MNQDEAILEYIEQCYPHYTTESITRSLLKKGYSQEAIDRAWVVFSAEMPGEKHSTAVNSRTGPIGIFLGLVLTIYLLWCNTNFDMGRLSMFKPSNSILHRNAISINGLFIITQVAMVIVTVFLQKRNVSRSTAWRLVILFNAIWFFIIAGTCLKI